MWLLHRDPPSSYNTLAADMAHSVFPHTRMPAAQWKNTLHRSADQVPIDIAIFMFFKLCFAGSAPFSLQSFRCLSG